MKAVLKVMVLYRVLFMKREFEMINKKFHMLGLSLIELLVSLAIGLVLVLAVTQVFLSNKSVYSLQDAIARNQENARFAIELMTDDIRMAGYMGCGNLDRVPVNVIADPPTLGDFDVNNFVTGLDNVGTTNTFNVSAAENTDIIQVRKASNSGARVVEKGNGASAEIKVSKNAGFTQGDTLLISDCLNADIFNVTNVVNNNNSSFVTLAHANNQNIDNRLSKLYGSDAEVMVFERVTYFVGENGRVSSNGRALRSLFKRVQTSGTNTASLEVVDGIEDMQITYGVDTTGNRQVNEYRTAKNITGNNWSRVVSVNIQFLFASAQDSVTSSSGDFSQTVQFNGNNIGGDGVLRDVYQSTIAVRNRLP